jgi:ribosomal protein L28
VSLFLLRRKKTVCRVGEKLITGLPIPGMNKHTRNSFLYLMGTYRPDVAGCGLIRMKNCMLGHQVARGTANVSLGKQWNIGNNISASKNYEGPWFEAGRLRFRLFRTSNTFRTNCQKSVEFWVKFMSLSICTRLRF